MKKQEIQNKIVEFIKKKFPKMEFNTALEGLGLSRVQKKDNRFLTITIIENKTESAVYPFKDVKTKGIVIIIRTRKTEHIKRKTDNDKQELIHKQLRMSGYLVFYAWNIKVAKAFITKYMKMKK